MAKKLLIRTPQTTDGINLRYGADKQVVYKETIVELGAKGNFESLNAKLPTHLRHEFKVVDVAESDPGLSNAELKKRLETLEKQAENEDLKNRIDELEKKLAAKNETADNGDAGQKPETAAVLIGKIKEAGSVEEVTAISAGDERKSVIEAASKRIAEITGK